MLTYHDVIIATVAVRLVIYQAGEIYCFGIWDDVLLVDRPLAGHKFYLRGEIIMHSLTVFYRMSKIKNKICTHLYKKL